MRFLAPIFAFAICTAFAATMRAQEAICPEKAPVANTEETVNVGLSLNYVHTDHYLPGREHNLKAIRAMGDAMGVKNSIVGDAQAGTKSRAIESLKSAIGNNNNVLLTLDGHGVQFIRINSNTQKPETHFGVMLPNAPAICGRLRLNSSESYIDIETRLEQASYLTESEKAEERKKNAAFLSKQLEISALCEEFLLTTDDIAPLIKGRDASIVADTCFAKQLLIDLRRLGASTPVFYGSQADEESGAGFNTKLNAKNIAAISTLVSAAQAQVPPQFRITLMKLLVDDNPNKDIANRLFQYLGKNPKTHRFILEKQEKIRELLKSDAGGSIFLTRIANVLGEKTGDSGGETLGSILRNSTTKDLVKELIATYDNTGTHFITPSCQVPGSDVPPQCRSGLLNLPLKSTTRISPQNFKTVPTVSRSSN